MMGSNHPRQTAVPRRARRPERNDAIPVLRAVKPREYGDTKSVVHEAFKQAGGVKVVGALFDLSQSMVYGLTDSDAKGSDLSLDRARRLALVSKVDTFAVDFATIAGGVFLSSNCIDQGECLADIGGDIGKSVADVVSELLHAITDGKLTKLEQLEIQRRTDTAIAALIALRARVGEGDQP